jgi:hypothetical protein
MSVEDAQLARGSLNRAAGQFDTTAAGIVGTRKRTTPLLGEAMRLDEAEVPQVGNVFVDQLR